MRLRSLLVGALAALVVTSVGAEPVRLKFASFVGPNHPLNADIINEFIERVNRDSEGTLQIELFPGGTLAKPADVYRNVQNGIAEMGWTIAGYTPGRFPELTVSELPFEVQDTREGSVAMWGLYERGLVGGFDDVKVISLMTTNPARMHLRDAGAEWNKLSGKKLRAASTVLSETITALGGTPVGMPVPQVAESLSKGVVDGALADWFSLNGWNIMGSTRTHFDVPLGTPAAYVIMNKRAYERLPEAAQQSLEKHGGAAFARLWGSRLHEHDMDTKKETAAAPGHTIVSFSESEMATLRQQLQPITDAWVNKTANGQEILEVVRSELKKARESISD